MIKETEALELIQEMHKVLNDMLSVESDEQLRQHVAVAKALLTLIEIGE